MQERRRTHGPLNTGEVSSLSPALLAAVATAPTKNGIDLQFDPTTVLVLLVIITTVIVVRRVTKRIKRANSELEMLLGAHAPEIREGLDGVVRYSVRLSPSQRAQFFSYFQDAAQDKPRTPNSLVCSTERTGKGIQRSARQDFRGADENLALVRTSA